MHVEYGFFGVFPGKSRIIRLFKNVSLLPDPVDLTTVLGHYAPLPDPM
jgi:hypothetical protein